jgi:hypothetical protein
MPVKEPSTKSKKKTTNPAPRKKPVKRKMPLTRARVFWHGVSQSIVVAETMRAGVYSLFLMFNLSAESLFASPWPRLVSLLYVTVVWGGLAGLAFVYFYLQQCVLHEKILLACLIVYGIILNVLFWDLVPGRYEGFVLLVGACLLFTGFFAMKRGGKKEWEQYVAAQEMDESKAQASNARETKAQRSQTAATASPKKRRAKTPRAKGQQDLF